MIAPFKAFVIPLIIYLMVIGCFFYGMAKRAELSVFLFAILAPLPSLWYPTHQFLFGKDTMDLLFVSAGLGMLFQGKRSKAAYGWLLMAHILYSYISVWVVTQTFGLDAPVTRANPILADWKNYALMLAWYFLAYSLVSDERKATVLVNIIVGVLLFMCWREISGFVAGSSFSWSRRAEGPFWLVGLNSNHFGAFIAQAALLALGAAGYEPVKRKRWIYYAAAGLSLYPLLYSYSRGAYLGFIAGLAVLGVLRYRMLLVIVVGLLIAWQTVLPDSVVDRISMTESEDGELEESAALRIVMWDLARQLFADNRWMGIGFQGFPFASADYPLHNVHNFYLQTAAEQGVIGLLLLALLLGLGLVTGWRLWRRSEGHFQRGLGLGVMGYTMCVAVVNVFGDRFSQLSLGSTFFLLLGTAVRQWQNRLAGNEQPAAEVEPGGADAVAPAPGALVPMRPHTWEGKRV